MKFYLGKPALEYHELVPKIMSDGNYRLMKMRGRLQASCAGGNGREILVPIDSLPKAYQELVHQELGDPYTHIATTPILRMIVRDAAAEKYYSAYKTPKNEHLSYLHQRLYTRQAEWIDMINRISADKYAAKEVLRMDMVRLKEVIMHLYRNDKINGEPFDNKLPGSWRQMERLIAAYRKEGYAGLVSKKLCNQNTRKVSDKVEALILSLYCQPHNPYANEVCRDFAAFMLQEKHIIDLTTGEAFEPEEFYVDGRPWMLDERTVSYYINKPLNKAVVDNYRLSKKQFEDRHRPFMRRIAPQYALSKITMDDTSSPFKMYNKVRPATYKVFDVASTAIIAMVMVPDERPNAGMIRELLRKMFALIITKGWNVPMEIEYEHALNRSLTGKKNEQGVHEADILTAGSLFLFSTLCAPKNPREKNAERMIKVIKYEFQKLHEGFLARPFNRTDANRLNEDKKEVLYTFEEIIQIEEQCADGYNAAPHPHQDKYPGMSRWQVLEQQQNPQKRTLDLKHTIQWIGHKTPRTTLRRGEVMVNGNYYRIPDWDSLQGMNDDQFTAFWLRDEQGNVPGVYLYQDGTFVTEAHLVEKFQQAKAEQTAEDLMVLAGQRHFRKGFDNMIEAKKGTLVPLGTVKADKTAPISTVKAEVVGVEDADEMGVMVPEMAGKGGGYGTKTTPKHGYVYDPEEARNRALSDI
ncbi:MAG: hypothetical protein H0X33_12335 [Taibaiella sp.]|nr:hypothetical protein [Taibaiella sp.]